MSRSFVYGAQFFRVPNPPRHMRRPMLEEIAQKHEFNVVRIYPTWDYFNPAPDIFDFEEIDEIMADCDELGLRVLLGIVIETAPYWLERQSPDARYVDARGRPHLLAGSPAQISGGWPGLCLDAQPVREAATKFITALAVNAKKHPSLFAYDIWNEPRLEAGASRDLFANMPDRLFCYCEHSQRAFQQWLQRKYVTIERLNEAWIRRFSAFEEVAPPPHHGTYTDWLDWRRFAIDSQTDQMGFRAEIVRSLDPGRLIESHTAHCPPIGDGSHVVLWATDSWALAERCDIWGASLFPGSIPRQPLSRDAQRLDIVRSNARGKDFWLTEIQGGSTSQGIARGSIWRPQDIRSWGWLAIASGARGLLYWAYHAEATGQEAGGYGLIDRAGRETDRSREAVHMWRLIRDHEETILGYRPAPKVAVLYDHDTSLLDFAMEGNDARVVQSHRGYYQAIWESDVCAEYVRPVDLHALGPGLLIVPWHLIGKDDTLQDLRQFLARGGTLLLEARFGLFDDRLFQNHHVPPTGLVETFGYEEEEPYYQPRTSITNQAHARTADQTGWVLEPMYDNPEITVGKPFNGRFRAETYLVPLRLLDAEPIAECHGHTVGVRKQVGKGTVYYFGTNLGAAIASGEADALGIVRQIIRDTDPPEVAGDRLRPRLIAYGHRALLAVFNEHTAAQEEDIRLPEGRWSGATDLYSTETTPLVGNALRVRVPAEDVRVFGLE